MKKILSISFCYHDSAITIADERKILIHIEYERFVNKKHERFRSIEDVDRTVKYALKQINLTIDDINEVLITSWNNLYKNNKVIILGKEFNAQLTSHHHNHIGTAFPSNFKKCVILCSDGGSEDGYTKLYYKNGKKVWLVDNLDEALFTGKFYGTIAQMLIEPKCSKAHSSGVVKLMGLSSYGKYNKKIMNLLNKNKREINKLHFEGVTELLDEFNLKPIYNNVWKDKYKQDIAFNAHKLWVDNCANYLKQHSSYSKNICLVGGCALNITLNSKLLDEKIYDNVYVSPISTDAGQSLGAILYKYPKIKCNYPYLGSGKNSEKIYDDEIIQDLINGKIIAWYQGKSEIGARALGHRSFFGIPTNENMRKKLSEQVKGREPYRPVACIIPREFVNEYFEQNYDSPYMTFCAKAKKITQKLAPAIVHVDGTTRVQTLEKSDNPILYKILYKLKEKGLPPILMNSSLNVMGEPIVETLDNVYETYEKSKADALYINGIKYREKKLISILIGTYDNQKMLEQTIKSFEKNGILNDKNIETIIIENSDRKAYEKTKRIEKKHNVRVYHEPKQSKSFALNKGISKSSGKYIYSTDDDVIIKSKDWLYKFIDEFESNEKLGYVSGKVSMYPKTANEYSKKWEKKGGLSKGDSKKYWSRKFLQSFKYRIKPWPLHKLCAGANQMIRRDVLLEVGGYSTFLGRKDTVDGLTLEIGYKIAKAGYELLYNPDIEIYHKHPTDEETIKKKLYYYGMQDTGVSMYIYLTNKDYRYLWWAIFGHSLYTIRKMIKHIFGKYPLSLGYLKFSLKGNLLGWRVCLKAYKKNDENDI